MYKPKPHRTTKTAPLETKDNIIYTNTLGFSFLLPWYTFTLNIHSQDVKYTQKRAFKDIPQSIKKGGRKKEKEERKQLAIKLISLKTMKGMKFEGHR